MASYAEYNIVRSSANAATDAASTARSRIKSISDVFENGIIVAGKSFDNGELSECIRLLSSISSNMSSISNYCYTRMNEIMYLQNQQKNSNSNNSGFHTNAFMDDTFHTID